jgi:hypothetical protein
MKLPAMSGRLLLIYQLPKVGSQTIEATLALCRLPHQVLRFHYLSPVMARRLRQGLRSPKPTAQWKQDARAQLDSMTRLRNHLRLRRLLLFCGARLPKIEVITGAREIIGLTLSAVFENYLYFVPRLELLDVKVCRDALLHPKTCAPIREWFDLELKRTIGLDIYQHPFPHDQGYTIHQNRWARVLLYRFEALEKLPAMLQEFLGSHVPTLARRNIGESKEYAEQYRAVKNELRLPPDFVHAQVNCRVMRHFYSEAERARFSSLWAEGDQKKDQASMTNSWANVNR